jgi:hypothetical protein
MLKKLLADNKYAICEEGRGDNVNCVVVMSEYSGNAKDYTEGDENVSECFIGPKDKCEHEHICDMTGKEQVAAEA